MITIVDYKMGNLFSIQNMLKKLGYNSIITSNPKEILNASKLILPGVGSFGSAMNSIIELNLVDSLNEMVLNQKIPILGICLGMQLMCSTSEEGGLITNGLNWVAGDVKRLPNKIENLKIKIPHIGWTNIEINKKSVFFNNEIINKFYFVHSYYALLRECENVLTYSKYGINFCSSFEKNNIIGVQFHPEKSHKFGLYLLKSFAEINK